MSRKTICCFLLSAAMTAGGTAFADSVVRDDVSGIRVSEEMRKLSANEKKRAMQEKRENLAMATREAGLRDAAMRVADREKPFPESSNGQVTEVGSETESDTGAMLIVALCVALLSIIRRMSSI